MSNKSVLVVRPSSWEDAVSFSKMLFNYYFRGQENASWGLSTKIERVCWRNSFPTDFLKNREDTILREFKRRAHQFINTPPSLDDNLEWMALLQHYGGSTRLLDLTESFYVAAFFAMETASGDSAIWALDQDYLLQHIDGKIGQGETIYDLHERSRNVIEKNLSGNHQELMVMGVVPERLNERIDVQKGLFAVPGDINSSFEENVAATFSLDHNVIKHLDKIKPVLPKELEFDDVEEHGIIKIILPMAIHNHALIDLDNMNINAVSLFQGIEGLTRSLNKYLRDVE